MSTSAATRLSLRNQTIHTLLDVDARLTALVGEEPSNRVVADIRTLLEHRSDLVAILLDLNGEPPPLPAALNPNETKVPE